MSKAESIINAVIKDNNIGEFTMINLITGLCFHIGIISITLLYILFINSYYNLKISKLGISAIALLCIIIFSLNHYMFILFSHGSKETLFSDYLILQLYFNLILLTPFIVLLRKLNILKIIIHLQAIFIIIYFYNFIITYYFYSTAPFHAGKYYWLEELYNNIKSILNIVK